MPQTNCLISSGISVSCTDLRKPGGLAKRLWIANLDDFRVRVDEAFQGFITNLEFNTYRGLWEIESVKNAHEATATVNKGDGGNVSFTHSVIIRAFSNTPTNDALLETLTVGDFVVIVETNNQDFLIYGAQNGLTASEGSLSTGRNITDSTAFQFTLTGVSKSLPKRLFRTDYNTTLAYINGLTN